ncbi:hypothetical protein [Kitasatospora sp. NPDC050543]|uniref:hypothetical protein n=1 Tax=Kitasatospora sp. NPDC050543 TaxID=3364054 RepID=UPI0037A98F56
MPYVPQDQADWMREMENRLRALEGRAQIRPAMNQVLGGDVVVGEGGSLKINDVDGSALFYVGTISPNQPDGSEQRGVQIRRQDGTPAIYVARTTTTQADPQGIVMRDAHGATIFAEDVVAGGVAFPQWSLLPPADLMTAHWPQTNATSFTAVAKSYNVKASPWLGMMVSAVADGGSAGEVRVMVNGSQWGPTTSTNGVFENYAAVTGAVGSILEISIEARRTSGSGTVYAQTLMLFGLGSS